MFFKENIEKYLCRKKEEEVKIVTRLKTAAKKTFTAFLVVLTMVSSTFVVAPFTNVSAASTDFENRFSKQAVIEANKLIPYIKYDLNGKWYDNGTGYAVSNLVTECNGFVRRTLVNTVYALEKQGVTIPAEYARLKTVTSNGLDMRGIHHDEIIPLYSGFFCFN